MNELEKPHTDSNPRFMPRWIRELDRLVRGEATRLSSMKQGLIDLPSDGLQIAIFVLGMVYGVCMGTYALLRGDGAAWFQLLSGMIKVPALFLLTLLITFPSLYVFNALVGSRLSIVALWRLLISSIAITSTVLTSFGPIVAFFALSTTSYSFMLLLNVFMFGVSGILGLKFLIQTLHRLSRSETLLHGSEAITRPVSTDSGALDNPEGNAPTAPVKFVFRCWILVFGLVGSQMGWVLRPFLGSPDQPFSFFRERRSNFFETVWHHIVHLFS